jgi:predicted flap endonuclease-1-like 5' DNA nuclease
MAYKIETIEGIGAVYASKLAGAGVETTADLLDKAKDPKGRKTLAAAVGIDESRVLRWANMADLMRIKGVGEEWSELLEAAGVDTVKELKHRVPANLLAAMAAANEKRKLVRQLPSEKTVAGWVEEAKALKAVMTY